jgi:hypothetical protein
MKFTKFPWVPLALLLISFSLIKAAAQTTPSGSPVRESLSLDRDRLLPEGDIPFCVF